MLEIKDVIQDLGWNWSKLPFDFPLDCKLMLQAIPISHLGRGCDRIAWADNPKGIFDLKSAYGIAMGDDTSMAFNADWIWKLKTLPHIQFFLWKCAHNSISVKDCLVGRGMGSDNQCDICHGGAESILHALRDCPRVQSIWRQLGVQDSNHGFWRSELTDWMNLNGKLCRSFTDGHPPWKLLFFFCCLAYMEEQEQLHFQWETGKSKAGY